MALILGNLFLGKADGESEAKEKDFEKLFYKNHTYTEITEEPEKFIVSGQKGTGKTVMARYIEGTLNRERNAVAVILNKNEIDLNKLIEQAGSTNEVDATVFYTWFFLKHIAKLILKKPLGFFDISCINRWSRLHNYLRYRQSSKKLERFIQERDGNGNFECRTYSKTVDTKESYGLNMGSKNYGFNGTEAQGVSEKKEFVQRHYFQVVDELKEMVINCLCYLDVVVFLDDLDEIESKLDTSQINRRNMLNLINATKDLNDSFYDNGIRRSKCILLIRQDILSTLNSYSSNLNKIIVGRTVNLYWNMKLTNPEDHPLMDMLLRKIRATNPSLSEESNRGIYNKLFPEKINGQDVMKHLLDNSFGRPRDIINHLNLVKANNRNAEAFRATMFKGVRAEYSKDFLGELLNEMHIHVDERYSKELFRLLREFNRATFTYEEISKFFREHKSEYKYVNSARTAVETLFKFGAIGNTVTKENQIRRRSLWSYRMDGSDTPDFGMRFSVHFALRKALNL